MLYPPGLSQQRVLAVQTVQSFKTLNARLDSTAADTSSRTGSLPLTRPVHAEQHPHMPKNNEDQASFVHVTESHSRLRAS